MISPEFISFINGIPDMVVFYQQSGF